MKEINIVLEKLMFLAVILIPLGIFMSVVQSGSRFSFAALATLLGTAVLILSFSILSPLLEIAANTREMAAISKKLIDTQKENTSQKTTTNTKTVPVASDNTAEASISGLNWTYSQEERDQEAMEQMKKRDQEAMEHQQRIKAAKDNSILSSNFKY